MTTQEQLERIEQYRQEEYSYLKKRLEHLKNDSEEDGRGDGYRVRIYGAIDWEDTSRPEQAVINWSATGDQRPETGVAFAEAIKTMAQRAADYNLERARIIVKINERERELKAKEA